MSMSESSAPMGAALMREPNIMDQVSELMDRALGLSTSAHSVISQIEGGLFGPYPHGVDGKEEDAPAGRMNQLHARASKVVESLSNLESRLIDLRSRIE